MLFSKSLMEAAASPEEDNNTEEVAVPKPCSAEGTGIPFGSNVWGADGYEGMLLMLLMLLLLLSVFLFVVLFFFFFFIFRLLRSRVVVVVVVCLFARPLPLPFSECLDSNEEDLESPPEEY